MKDLSCPSVDTINRFVLFFRESCRCEGRRNGVRMICHSTWFHVKSICCLIVTQYPPSPRDTRAFFPHSDLLCVLMYEMYWRSHVIFRGTITTEPLSRPSTERLPSDPNLSNCNCADEEACQSFSRSQYAEVVCLRDPRKWQPMQKKFTGRRRSFRLREAERERCRIQIVVWKTAWAAKWLKLHKNAFVSVPKGTCLYQSGLRQVHTNIWKLCWG